MYTLSLLKALFRHMQWADAEVWSAVMDTKGALDDEYIAKTLFHIHFTHFAYLSLLRKESVPFPDRKKFDTVSDLIRWAKAHYTGSWELLEGLSENDLEEIILIPWSKMFNKESGSAVGDTTRGDILFQIVAHAQYHRAQLNRRIRELGQKPPLVDFIVWKWQHSPPANWR